MEDCAPTGWCLWCLFFWNSPDWISAVTPPTPGFPLELCWNSPFFSRLRFCARAPPLPLLWPSHCALRVIPCAILGQLSAEMCHVLVLLNGTWFGRFCYPFLAKMALLSKFLLRSLLLPLPLVAMVTTSLAGHIFICDRSVSGVLWIEQLRYQARLPFPPHLLRLSFHTPSRVFRRDSNVHPHLRRLPFHLASPMSPVPPPGDTHGPRVGCLL